MRLQRCNFGHFYDKDKYDQCPICVEKGKTNPDIGQTKPAWDNAGQMSERKKKEKVPVVEELLRTDVAQVQVYRRGALVCRTGMARIKPGDNTLYISGLTSSADRENIRLLFSGKGVHGSIRILEETPQSEDEANNQQDELAETERSFEILEREINEKNSQIQTLLDYRTRLARGDHPVQDVWDALEKITPKLDELYKDLDRMQDLAAQLQSKQEEVLMAKEEQKIRRKNPCIAVDVYSTDAIESSFQLEYLETDAFWAPFWEIEADLQNDLILFRLKAVIGQATGEVWQRVGLSLNSMMPQRMREQPQLKPCFLGFRKTTHFEDFHAQTGISVDRSDNFTEYDTTEYTMSAPSSSYSEPSTFQRLEAQVREISSQSVTMEYAMDGQWIISGDGSGTQVDLHSFEASASFHYTCVPGRSRSAWLTAQLKEKPEGLSLAGKASVFLENAFLGYKNLNPDEIDRDFEISFGTISSVQAERKIVKKYSRPLSVLSGATTLRTVYEIQIRVMNHINHVVQAVILDQIPVSTERKITIEALDLSGGKLEEKEGIVKWDFSLDANEERTLTLSYAVTSPKNEVVVEQFNY